MFVSFYKRNNYIIQVNRSLKFQFHDDITFKLEFLNIPKEKFSKDLKGFFKTQNRV